MGVATTRITQAVSSNHGNLKETSANVKQVRKAQVIVGRGGQVGRDRGRVGQCQGRVGDDFSLGREALCFDFARV